MRRFIELTDRWSARVRAGRRDWVTGLRGHYKKKKPDSQKGGTDRRAFGEIESNKCGIESAGEFILTQLRSA